MDYYGEVENTPPVEKIYSTVDELMHEPEILQGVYITRTHEDGTCEFLFSLQRLFNELQRELNNMKDLGQNYIMDDWVAILLYQMKVVIEILEKGNSSEFYNLTTLKKPLQEIYEIENRGSLFSRVLQRFYAKKTAEEKYSSFTKRIDRLEELKMKQLSPNLDAKKYSATHVATNQQYTQMHMK